MARGDEFGYGLTAVKGGLNPCLECGVMTNGLHHVVPVSKGGKRQVPLCPVCHNLVHGCEVIQGHLIKGGLERARDQGVRLGPPVKLSLEVMEQVMVLRGEGLSMRRVAKRLGISVGSVHWCSVQLNQMSSKNSNTH
jgi:hypothetical protein